MNKKKEGWELLADDRMLEIIEKYKPENFDKLMSYTWGDLWEKSKTMDKKQQAAAVKAAQKSQKETADLSFKKDARMEALRTAERLNPNRSFITEKGKTPAKFNVTAEAEKIYQWLIKVLK